MINYNIPIVDVDLDQDLFHLIVFCFNPDCFSVILLEVFYYIKKTPNPYSKA